MKWRFVLVCINIMKNLNVQKPLQTKKHPDKSECEGSCAEVFATVDSRAHKLQWIETQKRHPNSGNG